MSPVEQLIKSAKELVAAVSFDDNGMMLGGKWQGGNGGLLSRETIVKADAVRRALSRCEQAAKPEVPHV